MADKMCRRCNGEGDRISGGARLKEKGIISIYEGEKHRQGVTGGISYLEIAKEYEAAGADIISYLTEPHYFQEGPV